MGDKEKSWAEVFDEISNPKDGVLWRNDDDGKMYMRKDGEWVDAASGMMSLFERFYVLPSGIFLTEHFSDDELAFISHLLSFKDGKAYKK